MLAEARLDFGKLDAAATELHLTIEPAEEHDGAVRARDHAIPRPVESLPVDLHEARRRQLRTPKVPQRKARPADEQLPWLAALEVRDARHARDGLERGRIHDPVHDARQRIADQRIGPRARIAEAQARADCGLRRAIHVHDTHTLGPATHGLGRANLTADDDDAKRRREARRIDRGEQRRRQIRVGDAALREHVEEAARGARRGRVRDDERRAGAERRRDVGDRCVEARREVEEDARARREIEGGDLRADERGEASVRDEDALGRARAPAREDDVRRRLGGGPGLRAISREGRGSGPDLGAGGVRRRGEDAPSWRGACRAPKWKCDLFCRRSRCADRCGAEGDVGRDEDATGLRVLREGAAAIRRERWIQREEGGAGEPHAEQSGEVRRRLFDRERDEIAGADALVAQHGGDGAGLREERGVRDGRGVTILDGHALGVRGRAREEIEDDRRGVVIAFFCRVIGAIEAFEWVGREIGGAHDQRP